MDTMGIMGTTVTTMATTTDNPSTMASPGKHKRSPGDAFCRSYAVT